MGFPAITGDQTHVPLAVASFLILCVNTHQRLRAWHLNDQAAAMGSNVASAKHNTPLFQIFNGLILLSSACVFASCIVIMVAADEQGVVTGVSHLIYSCVFDTASCCAVALILAVEFFMLQSFSLTFRFNEDDQLPDWVRYLHILLGTLSFGIAWAFNVRQYQSNQYVDEAVFLLYIAGAIFLSALCILFYSAQIYRRVIAAELKHGISKSNSDLSCCDRLSCSDDGSNQGTCRAALFFSSHLDVFVHNLVMFCRSILEAQDLRCLYWGSAVTNCCRLASLPWCRNPA